MLRTLALWVSFCAAGSPYLKNHIQYTSGEDYEASMNRNKSLMRERGGVTLHRTGKTNTSLYLQILKL